MPIHAPFWGVFRAHFPQMMSLIVLTPKRTILGPNHVIWAINRENRSRGSSWACAREKKVQHRTGQDRKKVTKGLYFTYLWRSPHWSDVHENLCSGWCSRRNHVCQVSKVKFSGVTILQGVEFFHFSYWFWTGLTTVQRYCAACDAAICHTTRNNWNIIHRTQFSWS